ncbi:MAG: ABC transporter ATP-binding protein [Acidobacteria bacterium]|nr:ABC transporter ATP-binding protein [Acidobacteriota bacterium]
MNDAQISVKNLSVAYRDAVVLKQISLDVRRGEFVSLVGPSGSGKTTLLNALAGFIPASGELHVPGKVGVVFQDYSVFPWMTVAQNIAFGLENGKKEDQDEIVRHHLKLIQLEDKGDRYPAQLSGGQVQRVGIARALAPEPEVIFMDEPYGALDRHTREKMQQWLLNVWSAEHKTIIFVTHDIDEAIFLSDRVLVLNSGKVAAEHHIPFDRPRDEDIKFSSEFIRLKKEIYDRMN